MKKKNASDNNRHNIAYVVAILIVGGVVGSVFSYMNGIQSDGPGMGSTMASAQNNENLILNKEIIQTYSNDNNIYILLPDAILNTNSLLTSQFSVMDSGVLNTVTNAQVVGSYIVLELAKPLSKKITTVSYRDGIRSRIYSASTGYLHGFNEKLVTPVNDINIAISQSCEVRIPTSVAVGNDGEDTNKLKWILSQMGYLNEEVNSDYDEDLVNAINNFQLSNSYELKDAGFNGRNYGMWTPESARIAIQKLCQ